MAIVTPELQSSVRAHLRDLGFRDHDFEWNEVGAVSPVPGWEGAVLHLIFRDDPTLEFVVERQRDGRFSCTYSPGLSLARESCALEAFDALNLRRELTNWLVAGRRYLNRKVTLRHRIDEVIELFAQKVGGDRSPLSTVSAGMLDDALRRLAARVCDLRTLADGLPNDAARSLKTSLGDASRDLEVLSVEEVMGRARTARWVASVIASVDVDHRRMIALGADALPEVDAAMDDVWDALLACGFERALPADWRGLLRVKLDA